MSSSSLMTTYLGQRITIEPVEWGYLISVRGPGSDTRLVAMSSSAMQALESAFNVVEDALKQPADSQTCRPVGPALAHPSFASDER